MVKSENVCGLGVLSTFLVVMRCSYQFFAVLRYSEPPMPPLHPALLPTWGEGTGDAYSLVKIESTLYSTLDMKQQNLKR